MDIFPIRHLFRAVHNDAPCVAADHALVADLSAAHCIKRRNRQHGIHFLTVLSLCDFLPIGNHAAQGCLQCIVTHKSCFVQIAQLFLHSERQIPRGDILFRLFGQFPLGLHGLLEAFFVHSHACFFCHILRQVDGEAVGVIEHKGSGAVNLRLALALQAGDVVVDNANAIAQGHLETFFLCLDHFFNEGQFFNQFRVVLAHQFCHFGAELVQECALNAQRFAKAHSTAQNTAQHIASALIAGQYAVADQKGAGTGMVGNHPEGEAPMIFIVGLS